MTNDEKILALLHQLLSVQVSMHRLMLTESKVSSGAANLHLQAMDKATRTMRLVMEDKDKDED